MSDFYKIRRRQNFTIVDLEMWAEVCQNRQSMDCFVINLPLRDQSSSKLIFLYKIWRGEEVPGPHPRPHEKFHRYGFKNVGLHLPKSPKMVIFGVNLPLTENRGVHRSIEKREYRCTTTNLPLCNGTVIVLKLTHRFRYHKLCKQISSVQP